MKNKVNLAEAFKVDANELQPKPEISVVETQPTEQLTQPRQPGEPLQHVADGNGSASRSDSTPETRARPKKRHIGGYFDEAVYRQVKIVGAEAGLTTQDILTEALNAFFRMHDKPPIA